MREYLPTFGVFNLSSLQKSHARRNKGMVKTLKHRKMNEYIAIQQTQHNSFMVLKIHPNKIIPPCRVFLKISVSFLR
jgi:hypothetical protein